MKKYVMEAESVREFVEIDLTTCVFVHFCEKFHDLWRRQIVAIGRHHPSERVDIHILLVVCEAHERIIQTPRYILQTLMNFIHQILI